MSDIRDRLHDILKYIWPIHGGKVVHPKHLDKTVDEIISLYATELEQVMSQVGLKYYVQSTVQHPSVLEILDELRSACIKRGLIGKEKV